MKVNVLRIKKKLPLLIVTNDEDNDILPWSFTILVHKYLTVCVCVCSDGCVSFFFLIESVAPFNNDHAMLDPEVLVWFGNFFFALEVESQKERQPTDTYVYRISLYLMIKKKKKKKIFLFSFCFRCLAQVRSDRHRKAAKRKKKTTDRQNTKWNASTHHQLWPIDRLIVRTIGVFIWPLKFCQSVSEFIHSCPSKTKTTTTMVMMMMMMATPSSDCLTIFCQTFFPT